MGNGTLILCTLYIFLYVVIWHCWSDIMRVTIPSLSQLQKWQKCPMITSPFPIVNINEWAFTVHLHSIYDADISWIIFALWSILYKVIIYSLSNILLGTSNSWEHEFLCISLRLCMLKWLQLKEVITGFSEILSIWGLGHGTFLLLVYTNMKTWY